MILKDLDSTFFYSLVHTVLILKFWKMIRFKWIKIFEMCENKDTGTLPRTICAICPCPAIPASQPQLGLFFSIPLGSPYPRLLP